MKPCSPPELVSDQYRRPHACAAQFQRRAAVASLRVAGKLVYLIVAFSVVAALWPLQLFAQDIAPLAGETVVTNVNDSGAGSLRQAIADTAAGGTIIFDSSLSSATIRLASQLTLGKNVTIDGSALATQITISGDTNNDNTGDVRLFTVNSGVIATLKNITFAKGNALSYGTAYGGAIYNDGDLTIDNSTFSANKANYAGAIGNWGTLRVRGSTFSSNQANHQGGAIMNFGTLDIANSTISGNSAGSYGGGISNVEKGATTLTNVTIWQNAANVSNLADSTATSGGGIYVSGTATAYPSTLAYANTIIAGSTLGNDCEIRLALSTLSVNQTNYVGDAGCSATYSGNPNLAALANNGGPTQTAAPNIGSPVINMGNDTVCANVGGVDQRGVARPWGSHCDIGSVEYTQAVAPIAGRNGALAFDGTNDYVSVYTDTAKVSAVTLGLPVKDITVEAWVNIAQFKKWSAFIGFLQDNGTSEWGWAMGTWGTPESDGVYFGLSTTGTGMTYLSDYSVLANRWVHLAGTYDGATMKLYVDGDLMNSSTAQSGNIAYADSWYRLGAYKDDDEDYRIHGIMDEVRVWNVARSQADIQADMYRRLTGSEAGLVNYWPMDEGSGTVTNDHKGVLNGTLVGLPSWMQTGPPILPGLDLTFSTNDTTPVSDSLLGIDPDGGALTFTALTQPSHGTLQITNSQTGAFTYTPTPNYNGSDSFTYRVTDAQSLTDDATVSIAVRSINSPPVAGRNGALAFDGANDIVDLGNISALNGVNRYTLEGWVRFSAFSNYATVMAKRQGDSDRAAMIQLYGSQGQLAVAVNGGYGYSSAKVDLNKWVHLAAVYDGTKASNADRLKLYIDGVQATLTFLSSVPATTPTTATRLTLGAEYNGTAPVSSISPVIMPMTGQLDEIRLWNVARSQADIQAAMFNRMSAGEAGLVGYWPLDEGSGNTTTDKAGSQTGVLFGGPGWINSSLPLRPGLDLTFSTLANIPVTNTLVGIDPDGGVVNFTVAASPAHGAVQITGAQSGAFIYTPAANFVGADAFTYQVADSGGLTDTATVTVTMSPPSTGAIEGVAFDDLNGNGAKDVGEPGVAGVTVTGGSGLNTSTIGDGTYRFGDVPVGTYTVQVTVPAGYVASGQTSRTVSVASGGAAKANFALQAQGVIQGVVFDDLNGNKAQDLGEPGIPGVTISGAGSSNTTGDDGSYRFSSISPGSYTLVVSVPVGYVAVGPTSSTVNVASGSSARANFILQAQGVIQGVVFDDLNGNGAQDSGESGIAGVAITRDDNIDTVTGVDGSYRFTDVVPSDYMLFVTVPVGYVSVGQTNRTVKVVNGSSAQANFALQAQGIIQGVVFEDRNGNGEQDSGEPGVGGVAINRDDGSSATTADDGSYRFSNVNAGAYTLFISVPSGFFPVGQTSRTVNVGSGGSAQANFSLQAQGAIQGVVYEDLNGNGRQDAGEPGIGGITVNRSGGPGTTTSLDGGFRFSNVSVGSYTLSIDVPAGYVAVGRTNRTVSVASGGAAQANFSMQAQGVIQGLVFDDRNGNGVQDSGESGINGVTIARSGGLTTATSLDGAYRFTDVVPAIYTLAITVPDGYVAVGQTSRMVNVPSGGSVRSNFILQARGVIQGVVFDDFNGNGVQDSGEAGVGGVVVSRSNGLTTTTSLDGSYRFSNVSPGSYTLSIAAPTGYVPSGPTSSTVNVGIGGSVQANFALQVQGVLGVVFDDLNGNGRQDGGEPGIGGVSVTLEGGTTILTSLDGKYRFSNVAPDSYFLYLDLPAGYVSVGRTNRTVTVATGGSARANFALQAQSVLQGVVFDDLNGNGTQDVGEAGVGGVTITRDDGPNATTGIDGSYLFTSVVPGGYTLFVGVPTGYVSVGQSSRVVNVASGGSAQANFALQAQGVIQGVVFDDRNGNNEQDSGEPGVGGVVISQSNGVTATTSSDGGYRFSNVIPGAYNLAMTVPAGFVATGQTNRTVNVGSGGSAQANFALQAQGAIQGTVFDDLNGNGRQDAGEPGIGGVNVSRNVGQPVTTGGDGSYRFSNVTVGSFTVSINLPAGYVAVGRTSRTVSVAAGGAAQANFALQAQGVIQGLVFDDRNGNGVQDNGETGISGVTVARGDGPTAGTSLDGTYRFTDVVPGAYALAITVPDSFVAVGQTSRTVNVGSGGSVQSNFILQARGVIQGVVFDDFNGNGVQDSGEAGIGGVVVSHSTGVTATTSLDGSYRFGNVAPGSCTVAVDVPAGYVASGQTGSTVNVGIGGSVQANFALQVQGVLGVVFDDLNGNGRQDGGEPGIGGVSIALEDGPTAITSLDGKYRFSNVAPGSYMLYLDLPAGYVSVGRTSRLVTVAAGGSARANFALQAQSVLQGVVFDDLNGNGAQDVGEAGVGGVTINRDDGPSTTTNGDGSYLFTSVVPGGYTLFLGVPAGYVPVGPTSRVVNVASGGSAQANFALQAQGVIQGVVFDDRNGNNEQDSGEPGVGGVVISQSNGVTATTSSDGGYRFSNVTPGSYTVGIAVPAGFVATGQTSRTVNVGSGGSAQANFALQAQGAIQGVVFDDLNGNNRQDADEAGIGGVTIGRSDGPSVATASDGSYRFSNVTVGSYTLAVDVPAGYVAVGRTSRTVSVAAGGAAQANFALQAQGVIQGLVFDDRNGNGVQDNGETGVGGVTVARGDGPTADTSLDGTYRFTDVVPGAYLLAITVPDSFVAVGQTSRTVNVGSGSSVQSNFILQARGVIQGVVFDDFNGNGIQDADESGVGGVTVSRGAASITTSGDGSYRFNNVPPGSYDVSIAVPAGYVPSGPTSSTVNVGIGGSVQANFALQVQGVLGVVFDDLNGNGRQDGGEPGIGGVSIALEDGPTATTSLDGKYRFANVAPGSYMLYLDLPAGYVSVSRTSRLVTVATGGSARANFALQAQSVLQGVVFDDLNGNGMQDVGEAGVGGVTITRDDGPNTTTSIDGSYLFTGVVPGGYTLFVGVPTGYVSVGQTNNTVNVASGGSAQSNFALQAQGVIQGVVFDDRNGNNAQDSGEPGIGGVVISQSNGVTETTSVDGGYRFSNVNPGSYTIGLAVPAGFVATGQSTRTVSVGSGGSAQVNFALQAQGVIQGVVFDDRSGNGRQDNGEPGVGGVTVTRSGGQQVTTAGDGSYRFNAVGVGSHAVTVTVPAGYIAFSRISRTVNVAGGSAAQANFILQAQGVIQGVVFDDRNFNGVKDGSDPGIGGVTITRGDGPATATSLDGSYIFTDVVPGRYTLSISVPAWYIAGSLTTRTLYVASGGSSPANFSLQANGAIGAVEGVVYEDSDGNGQQDFNEPGIGGAIITNPFGTVETGIDGTYRYANVPAGNYMLDVTLPTGYVASTLLTQPVGVLSDGSSGANFGLLIQSVIQGMVFADSNGNGAQDSGEAGVSGVTVKLFNRATEQLVDQRATSVNGDYRSAALAAGQYRVEIETPVGYSIPTASAAVLVDVDTTSSAAANFALRLPNSISGALFVDQNDNTLRDAGEPGLADVTIQVQGGASTLNAVTASDGSYLFSDVPSGIYSVSVGSLVGTGYVLSGLADHLVNLPAGQNGISAVALFTALPDQSLSGVTQPGSDVGLISGGQVQSSRSGVVAVPSVRVSRLGVFQFLDVAPGTYNLVVTPPPGFTAPQQTIPVTISGGGARIPKSATQLLANGTIRGVLFEDVDGNQSADNHEKGVGGVQVQLLAGSNVVQQVTAASNGSYQFNNVPNGDYQVNVTAAQFVQTVVGAATLTAERPGANLDVSMARAGTITGRVYRSDIGPAAGLENIALSLSGAAQQSTLTDADGFFHFDGLAAGAYVVTLSQLPDIFFPIGGSIQNVDLATAAGNGINFGLVLRSSVPTALEPGDEPTMITHLFLPAVANAGDLGMAQEASSGIAPEAEVAPAPLEHTPAVAEPDGAATPQAPAEESVEQKTPADELVMPEALPDATAAPEATNPAVTEEAPIEPEEATPETTDPATPTAAPAESQTSEPAPEAISDAPVPDEAQPDSEPTPDATGVTPPPQLHLPLIVR